MPTFVCSVRIRREDIQSAARAGQLGAFVEGVCSAARREIERTVDDALETLHDEDVRRNAWPPLWAGWLGVGWPS